METEGVNGGKHCVQALVEDREKFKGDDVVYYVAEVILMVMFLRQ